MAFINYSTQEVNYKLVYCGPGLSGKTTNILQLYRSTRQGSRGRLVSLYTVLERTLYFDFLPITLGQIGGFKIRLHLYSVPGQVCFTATRRLVFRGADGIVFVADSQRERMDANREALRDLQENFEFYGIDHREFPYVLQLNKRDLDDVQDVDFLIRELRLGEEPIYQSVASKNLGVQEALKDVARQILRSMSHEFKDQRQPEHLSASG